jgi:adenylate cyclase
LRATVPKEKREPPRGQNARVSTDLHAWLRERGASEAEIERAEQEGWLPLLALDRQLMPGEQRYDVDEVAARAGTDRDTAQKLWRALGFPDVQPGIRAFTDRDVEVLQRALQYGGAVDLVSLLRRARVISSALARVADVEADLVAEEVQQLRRAGVDEHEVAERLLREIDWSTVQELLDYVHRLQLRASLWRRLARGTDDTMVDLAIAFADLSGYTALTEQLEPARLLQLVNRWETLAHDTVAELGARIVKTIGDEVMFVGLPDAVAHAALALVRRAGGYPELPSVRAGVARGPVLARDGDFYGPVVNLSSRLTDIARAGTVLASASMHAALQNDKTIAWKPIGTRHVRGIGDVLIYEMSPAS